MLLAPRLDEQGGSGQFGEDRPGGVLDIQSARIR